MSSDMPNTEESQAKLGFSQNLRLSLRMHKISLRIRPLGAMFFMAGAFLEIASFLTAIFATARLGAKLAEFATSGHASDIWLWLFIDAIATIFTGLGFLLMSYGKRLVYFAFVRWSTDAYMRTLCKIDLGDFYDKEMRNTINKVSSGHDYCSDMLGNIYRSCHAMHCQVMGDHILSSLQSAYRESLGYAHQH